MKKIISVLFISALIFSSSFFYAKAQDDVNALPKIPTGQQLLNKKEIKDVKENIKKNIEEQKQNIQNEKEKIQMQIQSLRESAKQKMDGLKTQIKNEKNKTKAKLLETRIAGREEILKQLDERITNINSLKEKINTQIAKADTKGVDTTSAKAYISAAEAQLLIAQGKVTEVNALLAGTTNVLTAENKTKLNTLKNDVQNALKDAHAALTNALTSIKDGLNKTPPTSAKTETEGTN